MRLGNEREQRLPLPSFVKRYTPCFGVEQQGFNRLTAEEKCVARHQQFWTRESAKTVSPGIPAEYPWDTLLIPKRTTAETLDLEWGGSANSCRHTSMAAIFALYINFADFLSNRRRLIEKERPTLSNKPEVKVWIAEV